MPCNLRQFFEVWHSKYSSYTDLHDVVAAMSFVRCRNSVNDVKDFHTKHAVYESHERRLQERHSAFRSVHPASKSIPFSHKSPGHRIAGRWTDGPWPTDQPTEGGVHWYSTWARLSTRRSVERSLADVRLHIRRWTTTIYTADRKTH